MDKFSMNVHMPRSLFCKLKGYRTKIKSYRKSLGQNYRPRRRNEKKKMS